MEGRRDALDGVVVLCLRLLDSDPLERAEHDLLVLLGGEEVPGCEVCGCDRLPCAGRADGWNLCEGKSCDFGAELAADYEWFRALEKCARFDCDEESSVFGSWARGSGCGSAGTYV